MIRKTIIVVLTLAAVGTLVSGIASYFVEIRINGFRATSDYVAIDFESGRAAVSFGTYPDGGYERYHQFIEFIEIPDALPENWIPAANLDRLFWYESSPFYNVSFIRAPFWTVGMAFATYPGIAFIRGPVRRYRRRKKGLCVKCAYDLTGNESGTCPECGTFVENDG